MSNPQAERTSIIKAKNVRFTLGLLLLFLLLACEFNVDRSRVRSVSDRAGVTM